VRVADEVPWPGAEGYPSPVDNGADSTAARRGSILDRVGRYPTGRSPIADGIATGAILAVVLSNGFVAAAPGYVGHDLSAYQHEARAWPKGTPMSPGFEVQPFLRLVSRSASEIPS
jgi:hypothetical protein